MPARSQAQRGFVYGKFGPDWAKRHHFDNPGKLPEKVKNEDESISDSGVPDWAHYRPEAQPGVSCGTCDFFVAGRCEMFDYTTVRSDYVCDRWEGIVEKDDSDLSVAPMYTGLPPKKGPQDSVPESLLEMIGAIEPTPSLAGMAKSILKRGTNPSTLHLRVNGMTRLPSGHLSYRMVSREGHYVGRTGATHIHARKGDVLKIQANDFLQDEGGDFAWLNANVVSHYTDAPHDLRELEALAGGSLEKENPAPGPAGDIPAANDMGASSSMPDGPTLAAVHINSPLPNVSLFYGKKKLKYKMQKAYSHKQLIYGVVLEPNTLDSQDDYMLPEQVERAAHNYLKKGLRGKSTISRLGHKGVAFFKNKPSVVPVESYIAPTDFSYDGKEMVKKGTWVMVLHVEDPSVWDDVLKGEYTGLSIGGTGIRQDMIPMEGSIPSYQDPISWF
jgi:putative serine protease XkdF